uniref:5'-nucleotidase n=1 Tax=Haemonchus placei TaxID=6290 RepID=A0A0N4X465_HAEPC
LTLRRGDNGEQGCLTHEVFDVNKEVKGTGCTLGILQQKMNDNYETVLSNCTTDDERAFVQTGWKSMCQFLHLLEEQSIPLLIFSAGITDIIEEAIRQLLGYFPNNITVAANKMHFDEIGYVTGFTCPPVHGLSKTMAHLRDLIHGVDRMYSRRNNVIVIGDSESDAFMVDGWQEKKVLKVGLSEEEVGV